MVEGAGAMHAPIHKNVCPSMSRGSSARTYYKRVICRVTNEPSQTMRRLTICTACSSSTSVNGSESGLACGTIKQARKAQEMMMKEGRRESTTHASERLEDVVDFAAVLVRRQVSRRDLAVRGPRAALELQQALLAQRDPQLRDLATTASAAVAATVFATAAAAAFLIAFVLVARSRFSWHRIVRAAETQQPKREHDERRDDCATVRAFYSDVAASRQLRHPQHMFAISAERASEQTSKRCVVSEHFHPVTTSDGGNCIATLPLSSSVEAHASKPGRGAVDGTSIKTEQARAANPRTSRQLDRKRVRI